MAKQKYKMTFLPNNITVEVDPNTLPYGETGQPGSVLDVALANNIDMQHVCGGNIACSTCHVHVQKGLETCTPATPEELEMLETAEDRRPESRLGCQCVPNGSQDITVHIP